MTAACSRLKRASTISLVIAILATFSIPTESQPLPRNAKERKEDKSGSTDGNYKPKGDKRGTDQQPFVVTIPEAETAKQRAEREKKDDEDKAGERLWSRGAAVLTLILSAVTIAALFFQLRIMGKQNRIQLAVRKTTRSQALIANRQVSHFERAERAWLFPENLHVQSTQPGNGRVFFIRMVWRNAGNTPALRVRMNAVGEPFIGEMPSDFDFLASFKGAPRETYVGPKAASASVVITVPVEVVQAVIDGHLSWYIWGQVVYEDIFQGTETRVTQFCWRMMGYEGDGDPYSANQIGFHMGHEPTFAVMN